MTRVVAHVRRLWPGAGMFLPLPFVLWTTGCYAAGVGRWEHGLILFGVPVLAYAGASSKRLFLGLLPMGLLGLVYDAMRWIKNVGLTPARVHV